MATPTYPTSGTTSFNLDLTQIAEEAYELAGVEMRTGYDLRTARRSLGLMLLSWANKGINLWTVDGPTSVTLVAGTATYNLPVDTVDLLDSVIRTGAGNSSTQSDLTISRISESTYMSIPNKLSTGRPIQVWVNRQSGANNAGVSNPPQVTFWPIPDTSTTWTFVYYRLRRLQDPGTGLSGQDVPFRLLPALCAGLAYYLSMKIPNAAPRVEMLKQNYGELLDEALSEDRDKVSARFVPYVSLVR